MKTLQLNSSVGGGAAIACLRLHQALEKQGIDSSVLVLNKGKNEDDKVIPYFPEAYGGGLQMRFMRQIHILERKLNWRKVNKLEKGYESFSFASNVININAHPVAKTADILNLHWVNWWIDYTSFFKTDKPVVWTLHDMTPFSDGNPYEIGFPFKAYKKLLAQNKAIKQAALKNRNIHIVTLNKWMTEKSKNSSLFGNFEHSIIPNSINTSIFKPAEIERIELRQKYNIPAQAPVLLFIAGDVKNKRKGLDLLFEALKHYKKEQLYVVVVGKKMKNLPNIGKHKFMPLGPIYDKKALSEIYNLADFHVIPSREDNLPNTVMESITCSTPVIGFNIGGIPDMIQNDFNGLLCEELNGEELAKTIDFALQKTFNRKEIRQDAVKRFSPEVQAQAYLKLYGRLLENL